MKKIFTVLFIFAMVMSLNASVFAATGNKKISLKEAKKIAIDYTGANEKDAVFTKAHKDYDDGRQVYEIEFHIGTTEYNMDVDVHTGKITDFSKDYYERYDDDDDLDDMFDFDD